MSNRGFLVLVLSSLFVFARPTSAAPAEVHAFEVERATGQVTVVGQTGWNSLVGSGVTVGIRLHPHFTFEGGAGLSLTGWKAGGRLRVNLLRGAFTPFVAAGSSVSSGVSEMQVDKDDEAFSVKVKRSPFLQGVAGVEYLSAGGFTAQLGLGYSRLLGKETVTITKGAPTKSQRDKLDLIFRSGPTVELALGYTF